MNDKNDAKSVSNNKTDESIKDNTVGSTANKIIEKKSPATNSIKKSIPASKKVSDNKVSSSTGNETSRTINDLKGLAVLNTKPEISTIDSSKEDNISNSANPVTSETTETTDLNDKGDNSADITEVVVKKAVIDNLNRNYATGRRKEASARTWLKPGKGEIFVNRKPLNKYFSRSVLQMIIKQPFVVTERENQYNVFATVKGGGKSGQAGAVRHGIARALSLREPELRPPLKKNGLLTRDSRTVERKKYGLRKARRSFQFSKR